MEEDRKIIDGKYFPPTLSQLLRYPNYRQWDKCLSWNDKVQPSDHVIKAAPLRASTPVAGIAEDSGQACEVLMKSTPTGKQPLAHYNTRLDNIAAGLPPYKQRLYLHSKGIFLHHRPLLLGSGFTNCTIEDKQSRQAFSLKKALHRAVVKPLKLS